MIDGREALLKLILHTARFSGLAPLARPLVGGIGAILMLHRVTALPERAVDLNAHLAVEPAFLDKLLSAMKRDGYEFVDMDAAIERIRAPRRGDAPFAVITLDDGYRDNLTEALPVFEKHAVPFTIYIAPGLTDGIVDPWWDLVEDLVQEHESLPLATARGTDTLDCSTPQAKRRANAYLHAYLSREIVEEEQCGWLRDLACSVGFDHESTRRRLLMTWEEVRRIAAHPLATIGAHTVHHYALKCLSDDKARREIADAAAMIAERLGERPRHMAFPYGFRSAVGAREVQLAREAGYVSAVTTRHGLLRPEHSGHLQALPRISVNGRYQRVAHVSTMLSGVTTLMANAGRRVVTV